MHEPPDNGQPWRIKAFDALIDMARLGIEFSADVLRRVVGEPEKKSAVGWMFRQAHAEGLIEPTGRFVLSAHRRGGVNMLWRGTLDALCPMPASVRRMVGSRALIGDYQRTAAS
jgi:hypothetical protein